MFTGQNVSKVAIFDIFGILDILATNYHLHFSGFRLFSCSNHRDRLKFKLPSKTVELSSKMQIAVQKSWSGCFSFSSISQWKLVLWYGGVLFRIILHLRNIRGKVKRNIFLTKKHLYNRPLHSYTLILPHTSVRPVTNAAWLRIPLSTELVQNLSWTFGPRLWSETRRQNL